MTDFRRRPREDAYLPRPPATETPARGDSWRCGLTAMGGALSGAARELPSKRAATLSDGKEAGDWELQQQRRTWRRITGSLKRNNSRRAAGLQTPAYAEGERRHRSDSVLPDQSDQQWRAGVGSGNA